MSASSTPNDSPASSAPIRAMHNPSQAAQVSVPQAPLGNNVANRGPGMGAKTLLAKKFSNQNSSIVSPTDNLVTPVSQKLNAVKRKHFTKPTKPVQLFASQRAETSSDDEDAAPKPASDDTKRPTGSTGMAVDDDENPF
ncbi:hypothetical protein BDV98DRAFT_500029 [Pterulicium gracile]|uniref:Spo12 family-domain-containing protein n=1 Tax=Pterulicium gracile TaxID=1884261 RepID=A0A5C3R0E1_9AGAR|nr:hypothetical protein BDV98DRAFT_500029 [Pterula gracilis]